MSKKLVLLIFVLFFSSANIVLAQTTTSTPAYTTVAPSGTMTTTTTSTFKPIRAENAMLKSKIQTFREQIQAIKDERKKALVAKIEDHIATSNARLTTKMTNALNRMTQILQNMKDKATTLKTAGKNTAALDAAIVAADTAIANAKAAVLAQSQKEYSTTLGDDSTLKGVIGLLVSQFRLDLTGVYKLVVDARQALANVIMEVAKLGGVGDSMDASGSAKPQL